MEQDLLTIYRAADLKGEIVLDDRAEALLEAVFELLLDRARRGGGPGVGGA